MLDKTIKMLEEKRKNINKKIELLYEEISEKNNFIFTIKDHAIVRYQQRVELLPPSEISYKLRKLLTEYVTEKNIELKRLDNIIYKLKINSVIYLIRNYCVITIELDENAK